jgi:hypothetical protein
MAPCPATLIDTYYNTSIGDNVVCLINPVSSSPNVCAMIYVFDNFSTLGACCGCPLSPQKLLTLSVESNLTQSFILGQGDSPPRPQSGVIDIISTPPDNPSCLGVSGDGGKQPNPSCNGGCDPTVASQAVTSEVKGDIVHSQASAETPEVPFAVAGDPDTNTEFYLANECADIVSMAVAPLGSCNCGNVSP